MQCFGFSWPGLLVWPLHYFADVHASGVLEGFTIATWWQGFGLCTLDSPVQEENWCKADIWTQDIFLPRLIVNRPPHLKFIIIEHWSFPSTYPSPRSFPSFTVLASSFSIWLYKEHFIIHFFSVGALAIGPDQHVNYLNRTKVTF